MASSVLQPWDGTRRTSGTLFNTKTFFVKTNAVRDLRTGNMICLYSRTGSNMDSMSLWLYNQRVVGSNPPAALCDVWRFHKTVLRFLQKFLVFKMWLTRRKLMELLTHWWLLLLLIWSALKFLSVSSCVMDLPHMVSQHAPVLPAADVLQVWRRADDSWLRADSWSAAHTPHTHSASSVNQSINRSIFCSSTGSLSSFLLLFLLCEYKQEVIILLVCFRSHMTISWWHHNEVTRGHWATAEREVQITSCLLRVVFLYCVFLLCCWLKDHLLKTVLGT